ncbi:hypothetical protein Pmani_021615 [Petrolisthes manimaculis]|uniref:Uncharacterized protein n=1 Tax=Petrolisthes manimaculis TaxID=1843537 RepID=A0AAE1PG31_9EUCA|nr:hypothetical protein Pmani_021615 [Petrolisthes manimaculis]
MMVGGGAFGGGGMGMGRGGSLTPDPPITTHTSVRLPSPHSPPSPASSDSPTSPASPGRVGANKACGVCGDIAKSMHFGGLSCDSCKAFFRRSVQNNAHKGFTCPYDKKCVIAISSRKSCQYCRFHKCLSIGMEKGWVMTENERRKMMQQRQDKKNKDEKKKVTTHTETDKYHLSEEDNTEISIIVQLYKKAYQDVPYDESAPAEGSTSVMSPWMTFCKRMGYFFSLFREFAELSSNDQALLLKTAITSACIIMGSVVYDSNTGSWPGKSIARTGFVPSVTSRNVERFVPAELMSRVEHFFRKFQQICPDETMAMILILVSLYSPELMGLEAKETIQNLQDRYTRILHKYVCWKYREEAALMFPKVIVSLADIRELAERTSQMRIQKGATSNLPTLSSFLPKNQHPPPPTETPMETNEDELTATQQDIQVKKEHDINPADALRTPAAHKRMRMEATGGDRDHTYQGIVQKIMEMHTSVNLRAPSLLPFIIQIVKKVGAGNSSSGPRSRVGGTGPRQHSEKQHRKRQPTIEVKEEHFDEDLDSLDMAIASPIPPTTLSSPVLPSHHSPFSHQLLQSPQQQQQQQHPHNHQSPHHHIHQKLQHHQQQKPQQQHLQQHQQFATSPGHNTLASTYPASPMESDPCDQLPPSPLDSPSVRLSPHSIPAESTLLIPNLMVSPQTTPVAPYTPPVPVPSQTMGTQQTHMVPVADLPLPSPVAAPSPYSDTSTSSPESSQSPLSELFSEELSDVEIDVLTQLLDYVSNFDNLENVSSLKEILPPHLLSELKTKLCSYSIKQE